MMARFYGSLQGRRGEATRLGDSKSGIEVEACSWKGKVHTFIGKRDTDDADVITIHADTHHGSDNPTGRLFHGTFDELRQLITWWDHRDEINAVIALLGTDKLARLTEKAGR
jgi:hypothetical protein